MVLAGTGAGIAFFMLMVSRSGNVAAIAVTARLVVLADWIFTAPAVVVQLVTGLLLMQALGYAYSSLWFMTVAALFVFIGLCWIPVVIMQYRLLALATTALISGQLPPAFKPLMRWWMGLGLAAFSAILVIFWLMVFKPLAVV